MHPFFLAVVKKKLPQILNQMNLKVTPGSCLQITGEQRSVKPICSIKLQSFCQVSFDIYNNDYKDSDNKRKIYSGYCIFPRKVFVCVSLKILNRTCEASLQIL